MPINITKINHKNKKQAQDLTYLLNQYAQDPMGGGKRVSHALTFMILWCGKSFEGKV